MGWLYLLLRLGARRVRSSPGLLVLVAVSILAAVTLVTAVAMYSHALAEAGLSFTVSAVGETPLQMRITVRDRPLGKADYQRLRNSVESVLAKHIGWLERYQHRYGRSQAVPTAKEKGSAIEVQTEQAFLSFFTGFREKTRLTEGRWPENVAAQDTAGVLTLDALVGSTTARRMHWQAGSTLLLLPYGTGYKERLNIRIAGIVEPQDPGDVYWLGDLSHFDLISDGEVPLVPLFLEEEAFFDSLGAAYPWLLGSYGWRVFLKTETLTTSLVSRTQRDLEGVEIEINKRLPRSLMLTGLTSTLRGYERDLQLARVPLFLFASLVVGLLFYFLALAMSLMVRNRAREMTLLRSRGATALQAAALATAGEGLAMTMMAVGLGPLLGWAITRTFLAKGLSTGGGESAASLVTLTPGVYLLAAVVGAVAFVLFFLTGLSAARLHLADFLKERARPPGTPLVHRYYLDILALVVLGVVLWQVRARGGFVSERLLGGLHIDPTLLVGPVIALVAAAVVLLRVLPIILNALSWASERVCPAWASLPLKRMARDPIGHGLLAIIVMAAAALGTFAAAFGPTLVRNQHDQVHYSTPSDIVLREPLGRPGEWELVQRVESLPGVKAVTTISRQSARLAAKGAEPSVTLMAVTPETLPDTAWFRPDFADRSLAELSKELRSVPVSHESQLMLPPESRFLGIWARLKQHEAFLSFLPNLWASVVDSQGNYQSLWLGQLSLKNEWQYMEAPLPEPGPYVEPPFRLVAIYFGTTPLGGQTSGALYLDDMTVKGSGLPAGGMVIEGFEEKRPWAPLPGLEDETSTLVWKPEAARSGGAGLEFSWPRRSQDAPIGIFLTSLPYRLPALGGPGFTRGQEVLLHDVGCLIPLTVQDVTRYFPTADPSDEPFLLVNLWDYNRYLQELPQCGRTAPTEYWISHYPDAEASALLAAVHRAVPGRITVQDTASAMAVIHDPLRPGAADVTSIGLIVLAAVVLLGLAACGAAFLERTRVDLAVARTLGLLRRHAALSLLVERIPVVLLGVVAGWGIGMALSRWALGYLAITPAGKPVVPPMLIITDPRVLAAALGSIGGAAAVTLLLGAAQAISLDVAQILRQEE